MSNQFSQSTLSEWSNADYWRSLCRDLTIGVDGSPLNISPPPTAGVTPSSLQLNAEGPSTTHPGKRRREQLRDKGFAVVDEPVAHEGLITSLRRGIQQLHEQGFPATFIFLFDQAWELAAYSRQILKDSNLDSNDFHFDLLAWCIDSDGFSPHRDRQPENVASSFVNGEAKFVTQWIALTEATPDNSCLYMIPKQCDPGYEGDDTDDQDPLQRALPTKEAFQQIRCFPRKAGQSVLFTHRIAHWGSARDKDCTLPHRIAVSFVCSDPSFEKPYIDPSHFTTTVSNDGSSRESSYDVHAPPFPIRLLLVCAQLLIYYQRFNFPKQAIKACYDYCKKHEVLLEVSYRDKVFTEFIKAMKEAREISSGCDATAPAVPTKAGSHQTRLNETDENDDEEEEDAMMEEMLNAEERGVGQFEDDYDDLDDGDAGGSSEPEHGEDDSSEEEEEETEEADALFANSSLSKRPFDAGKEVKSSDKKKMIRR